ncbi:cupin domain-containing protein [Pseudochryseolinea flava]|uniref:Cupin domain-containing protein n=1 Tax=Pseudochryseolinea flava TaxID=2059302 RepID=A0A364Y4R7_9BACT|nr:cupin domain-containing protein [Pseudochryseolinea flava]RAW01986.1 cupin domain-containing protein [Pseudochryseolinea flava]
MKHKLINFISPLLFLATLISCNDKGESQQSELGSSDETIFPKGELGPATNFTGNAYNFGLVSNDTVYNTLVGNVYFEKGARSNWHVHPSGQILIVLDGEGYHQLEGQPKQTMKKGDVIKCPPKIKHWHGATEKNNLTQMYILPKTQNGIVTWLEVVTDEQYLSN